MKDHAPPLTKAAELLRVHYGSQEVLDLGSPWTTAVALVLRHGRRGPVNEDAWTWIPETPLASPSETLAVTPTVLARILESHKQPAERARSLHRLAGWWSEHDLGRVSLSEESKTELRSATSLPLETIDQILLVAGRRRTFPVGRAVQRIVCRHGWLDPQTEYEEWQAFLTATSDKPEQLAALWLELVRVGHEFCGPKPRCDGCPLKPLLPEGGPVEEE